MGIQGSFQFKGLLIATTLLLQAIGHPGTASARQPVVLDRGEGHYPLGLHLQYAEDEQGSWTIEDLAAGRFDARFEDNRTEIVNLGYSKSIWWFRVDLQSRLGDKSKWLLEVGYPLLDRIELFVERPGGGFERTVAGERFPFHQRANDHRNFVFPVEILPGQRVRVFLRVDTESSVQVPLILWSQAAFVESESNALMALGIFNGLLLVMILYNLFLFFAIRDKNYLYYVLFVVFVQIMLGSFDGLPQKFLWSTWPWWANRAVPFGIVFAGVWLALFTRDFLDTRRHLPRWSRVLSVEAVLCLVASVFALIIPYRTAVKIVSVYALIVPLTSVVVGFLSWRRGVRPARYFLLGWTLLLIGCVVLSGTKLGIVPRNFITDYGAHVGLALNVILLSFALADRINIIREEKERAQRRALLVQRNAAENLEREVERKTLDLQKRTLEAESATQEAQKATQEALEAKEELAQAYERLAEHDQLKSRFFANVSHELRTPLTLILTPLQRLIAGESGEIPKGAREQLRSMVGNTQRLLRLVNQLLDFSRIESGGATVSFEESDVHALVAQCVQGFESFARSKGLTLELRGSDKLPDAYIDPSKLEKVVANLLSNACKFTEPGGTVVVRLASDDSWVSITVKDTGIGIAQENLLKIFERFSQVDGSASRQYEGTGIGLALSKELVDLTGGQLLVESDLGVGSTFTVCLPLGTAHIKHPSMIRTGPGEGVDQVRAPAAAEALAAEVGLREPADASAEPAARTSGDTREKDEDKDRTNTKPLVVVAEDNPDMLALVSEICQQDFRVLGARNGQQGLDLVTQHRPSLVISDIMMPGIDGYELLRRVRSNPDTATIPVILLTAKVGPEMRLEGLESGADDYLTKPFESRELLARAHNLVRLQRQERELRELNTRLQQEVVLQSSRLDRARILERYLPPAVARQILEGKSPLRVVQERRRLTVFRLELRAFDEMAQLLESVIEPEDMATMLNTYLSEMMEVAFAHGATVDKFLRDTVVGFFGAPTSEGPEQDARRCVRMAIEMWQRAAEISGRWKEILDEGYAPIPTMVLTSGAATVGNFGSSRRLEYTAMGGPVDEASLMMEQVDPGVVVCNQTTWVLLQGEIEGEFSHAVLLRSRERPVKLYRLAGPLADAASLPTRSMAPDTKVVSPRSAESASLSTESFTGTLRPGTVFARRYEILQTLGKGGMGTVYRARDLKLDTEVALKLMRNEPETDPQHQKRMYLEVKLARLVNHPSVARIYDLGEWHGCEFITMEYIPGETLRKRLKTGGALSLDEGMRVLHQLCAGLGAAHAANIVHRDLKPSNIILAQDGRVTILDFGIARWCSALHRTGVGTRGAIGTPAYMAPEQFDTGEVDLRADIYSLGVVLFEMFTGHKPFKADSMAHLAKMHTLTPPPSPLQINADLPPRLSAVILRCLEKSPGDRFSSVVEISSLLEGGEVAVAMHLARSESPGHEAF